MTSQSGNGSQDEMVVGYFAEGADAYRAIHELIDEGFNATQMGAAFRTPRAGADGQQATVGEIRSVGELTERSPALYNSVGGPASGDEGGDAGGAVSRIRERFPGGTDLSWPNSRFGNSADPEARPSRDTAA
jgi:hypothetical protein